jgi:hypothetical protein
MGAMLRRMTPMPDIPIRLVVISARVPEGELCHGCTFDLTEYGQCQIWPDLVRESAWPHGDAIRLPACRERDGWVAYPPGSGVAELVEAAKRHAVNGPTALVIEAACKVAGEGER